MDYPDYRQLESDSGVLLDERTSGSGLLLLRDDNSLDTLALFCAGLSRGRTVGVADQAVLSQVNAIPVPGTEDSLYLVDNIRETGPGLVCFTSGATGTAKGILRSYESWIRSFEMLRVVLNFDGNPHTLIIGSLSHSMHLFGAIEALDRRSVPTVLPSFSPKQIVEQRDTNVLYATPTHLAILSEFAEQNRVAPLDGVQYILTGGAKFDETQNRRLRQLFPNAHIAEFFGTSETSFITLKSQSDPVGSVGKACPGVDMQIRGDDDQLASSGREGTLWVKSDLLFERYIIGDDLNTRWRDGYVSVGDQGYLDTEGNFYFTARKGLMVTIAGENVYLDVLENYLKSCLPGHESAIVPMYDAVRGTRLVAAVQNASFIDSESVLKNMRAKFGALKSPRAIVAMDKWPSLPSGKVDRAALAADLVDKQ